MTEQILVPFAGEESGAGELTRGQYDMWQVMQREKTSLSIGGWLPLPPGSTVADVISDLQFLRAGAVGRQSPGRPARGAAVRARDRGHPGGRPR